MGAKTAQAIRNVWARVLQIEPAGATPGKFYSIEQVIEKLRQEYMATSATISMTFASV